MKFFKIMGKTFQGIGAGIALAALTSPDTLAPYIPPNKQMVLLSAIGLINTFAPSLQAGLRKAIDDARYKGQSPPVAP